MPREVIRDLNTGLDDDDVAEGSDFRLVIGWSKEGQHVQVATLAADGKVLEGGPEANGWFVQLDRAEINRAIRALRTARDQAFGRDE